MNAGVRDRARTAGARRRRPRGSSRPREKAPRDLRRRRRRRGACPGTPRPTRDRVQVVAALEREHDAPAGEALEAGGQPGVPGRRDAHLAERISVGRVEARRDQDEVRREETRDRQQHAVEGGEVLGVAHAAAPRHVDGEAAAGAAADLRERPRARVERRLVRREVEDRRVLPEGVLRAVAVVEVPVDDEDPLGGPGGLERARRDGDVVEETEAHGAVGLGVVAGRTDERESVRRAVPPAMPAARSIEAPRGQARRARGVAARVGVRIELEVLGLGGSGDAGEVDRRVNAQELVVRRLARGHARRSAPPDRSDSRRRRIGYEAARVLGMLVRRAMPQERLVVEKPGRHRPRIHRRAARKSSAVEKDQDHRERRAPAAAAFRHRARRSARPDRRPERGRRSSRTPRPAPGLRRRGPPRAARAPAGPSRRGRGRD